EDLDTEVLNPLIYAKPVRHLGQGGWHYRFHVMSARQLAIGLETVAWEPVSLTDKEALLVGHLCSVGEVNTEGNAFWRAWASDPDVELEASLSKLRSAGLAALDERGILRLLTDQCEVAVVPDVGWVAGENSTGRM